MLPIANRPMMEHVIHLLRRHGFDEIVVTVAFLANAIKTYFGDGSEFGVTISYADEPVPLGTAGSVGNARELLDERFLVISGDVITDIDLTAIVDVPRRARRRWPRSALTPVENPLEFGIVITREDGTIERFLEKPTWGQVFSDTINTGIYVLEPDDLRLHPGRSLGRLLQRGVPAAARRRPAAVRRRGRGLLGGRRHARGLPPRPQGRARPEGAARHPRLPGSTTACGSARAPRSRPTPRSSGRRSSGRAARSRPAAGSASTPCSARTCRVLADVHIERMRAARQRLRRRRAPASAARSIGRASSIRANVRIDEGVVLGDEVFVGADAVLGGDVKVYPFKTIEDGAVVNTSIVWESRGARSLFGRDGVSGLANVDITPELAAKLAMAYGTSLRKGTTVVTSRDSSRSARMLKRAMMAGLNAAGDRRARPRGGARAGHPVPRPLAPGASAALTVRLRPRRPVERGRSASSTRPAPTSPRTPSARSSACSSGRTTGGCCPRRSATSRSRTRALEDYTVALGADVEPRPIADAGSSWSSTTATARRRS